jgi:hypothetical protein
MKRLLALCLAIPMAALFVGCDSSESPKSNANAAPAVKGGPPPTAPVPTVPQKGKNKLEPGAPTTAD